MTTIRLHLNHTAKISDVMKICGILAGCKKELVPRIAQNGGKPYNLVEIPSVKAKITGGGISDQEGFFKNPGVVYDVLCQADDSSFEFRFHMESDDPKGRRLFSCESSALNVAIAEKLFEIYGGELRLDDRTEEPEIRKIGIFKPFWVSDGNSGHVRKQRFFESLSPISADELISADGKATIKTDENELNRLASVFKQIEADALRNKIGDSNVDAYRAKSKI